MKRVTAKALSLALALALLVPLAGCSQAADETRPAAGGAAGDQGDADSTPAIQTAEDVRAVLDSEHSSADWYADMTGVTVETHLGAPVFVVETTWLSTDTDWEARSAKAAAMGDAIANIESPITINFAYRTADGVLSALGSSSHGSSMPMADAYELPTQPTTAADVEAWLAAVWGPDGLIELGPDETWYDSITGISMDDVGSGPQLTVTTTLGADDPVGIEAINRALQTTGSPLLATYAIQGSNGYFLGGVAPAGDPGMNGYYYPTE